MVTVRFTGGPKDGVQAKQFLPLPRVLVFQGLIRGRFRVLDYVRVGGSATYAYRAG